jgi:site-specific recombinase XerD
VTVTAAVSLGDHAHNVIDGYADHLAATRPDRDNTDRVKAAEAWWGRFGGPGQFTAVAVPEQLDVDPFQRRFVDWLITTGALIVSCDYVAARKPALGSLFKHAYPQWRTRFGAAATELGFRPLTVDQQWNLAAQLFATTGASLDHISGPQLHDGLEDLIDATRRAGWNKDAEHRLRAAAFGLEATLFHLGSLERIAVTKRRNRRAATREDKWAGLAPTLTATAHHYLDQMAVSMRPSTIDRYEIWLRQFATYLASLDPPPTSISQVDRSHIETYKLHLSERASQAGEPLNSSSIRDALGVLRLFFERLCEWDHPDAPPRVPVFSGDIPIKNRPLPRFLDDVAAAKLLRSARTHPDLFTRISVETLARTGLRRSELLGLCVDATVQIGTAWWLRVPIGKLHTDRYIPLHPDVKHLLDQWLDHRPTTIRSQLMFIELGRPISAARVNAAVANVATQAGIGHVTPHQLRHTLATQAINRGMSLESIAALLGHQSMDMTLTYARIADRTVADEYFSVTEQIEAFYDQQPAKLPADAEGQNMARTRHEHDQRLLGNGWCSRPPQLDCQYETICESCAFFTTGPEFLPTLQRQHDDAAAKGHTTRQGTYDRLITILTDAS